MENNLPKGWIEVKLEEVAADVPYPIGDGDHGQIKPSMYQTSGVPYIRVSDMGWGEYKPDNIVYISKEVHSNNLKSELLPGDVLIAKTGATIGKCCIVPENVPKANTTSSVGKITIDQRLMKSKWLLYFFLTREFKDYMWSISERTAQPGFNNRDIKEFVVPLPPYNEQLGILEKLDALMARISNSKTRLDKIPAVLKNFRQSVLAAAASGELTKEWREENDVESADNLLMRFEDYRRTVYNEALKNAKKSNSSKPTLPRALKEDFYFEITETDELPNSWQWTVIDKIGVVALGGTPSRKIAEYWKGDINWVSSGEVSNNRISDTIEKITQEGLENSNAKIYPKGTVLLAMIGEGKTRGQSSILDAPSSTNQNVAAIILNNDFFHSEYVWYYLQSIYERIRKDGSGGAQQALNGFLVGQLNIAIPPLEEQKEIVRKVEELFHFANSIEARYQKAKAWFDKLPQAILAKAFRGELVSQNENDEPASELLKRIQNEKHSITKTPKPAALKTKAKKYRMDEDEGLSMVAEG